MRRRRRRRWQRGRDYCDQLKDAKERIDAIDEGDFGNFEELSDTVNDLADAAPDEIKDDWEVLKEGFDAILAAFEKAGIDAEDFEAIQNGEIPEGVDMATLQAAFAELEELERRRVHDGERQHQQARQGRVRRRPGCVTA